MIDITRAEFDALVQKVEEIHRMLKERQPSVVMQQPYPMPLITVSEPVKVPGFEPLPVITMRETAQPELNHDTDALMEAARQSALAEAARLARHYATIVPMHGSLKSDIYEAAGQAATEIAASIEALAEKGVADLAAQAKRAALGEKK